MTPTPHISQYTPEGYEWDNTHWDAPIVRVTRRPCGYRVAVWQPSAYPNERALFLGQEGPFQDLADARQRARVLRDYYHGELSRYPFLG